MSQQISNRRAVLKNGIALSTAIGAVGLASGLASAASYEYELLVDAESGSGRFEGLWDGYDFVEYQNLESGDYYDGSPYGYNVDLSVDSTFSPTYDIVRFNADSIYPSQTDAENPGNIQVVITDGSQTVELY